MSQLSIQSVITSPLSGNVAQRNLDAGTGGMGRISAKTLRVGQFNCAVPDQ
jgi:hypothetical protein